MRIGIVCHSGVGGSARVATELAFQMQERNHAVCLFSEKLPFPSDPRHELVEHRCIAPDRARDHRLCSSLHTDWTGEELRLLANAISDYCVSEGLDVLHIHYAVPFASLAGQITQRCGAAAPAMVVTLHGTDVSVYCTDPDRAACVKNWLEAMDAITTVSKSHARLSKKLIGMPNKPSVIPNFVDTCRFFPRNNGWDCLPVTRHRPPRVAYVSNFRSIKAPEVAARIFADLRQQLRAEFWLIGDGEHMPRLKQIITENRLTSDCRYFGLSDSVADILRRADICIVPSREESFGLAALEAMASGLPVIASDVGGLPELIGPTRAGLTFPVGDYRCASKLLQCVLADPGLYQNMSRASVARARTFNPKTVVDQYEDLYLGVTKKLEPALKRHRRINGHRLSI